MKARIYCKFCDYEGAVWYSAETGGDDASFSCDMGKYSYEDVDKMMEGDLFLMAQNCEHFELKEEIKKLMEADK